MKITVRYFARIREALGPGEDLSFGAEAPATVGALRDWLAGRSPGHQAVLNGDRAVRAACDQVMCDDDESLRDGAEVAFFPPVTGG